MTTPLRSVRVLIVDDSSITRAGVAALLVGEPGIEVIGQADGGRMGLALCRQLHPDVVVTDLRMPDIDGVQLTALLLAEERPPRVLVLTHYDGDETVFRALKAGALGYVPKDIPGNELVIAIRKVAAGERFMPPEIGAQLARRAMGSSLSPREVEVLSRLADGLTNPQIAQELNLARKTVAMYVSQILEKLEARTRTEAVSVGIRRGIIRTR